MEGKHTFGACFNDPGQRLGVKQRERQWWSHTLVQIRSIWDVSHPLCHSGSADLDDVVH